ncbi:MAG: peptidoglycan DD-metalloendopeptidase family protein [Desulfurivibrionaceae bacterium]|nr:peptidoglycan DD-metalloendopeptidase family protein [Desulfurivibrionaceae bacterium]
MILALGLALCAGFFLFDIGDPQSPAQIPPESLNPTAAAEEEPEPEPLIARAEMSGTVKQGDTVSALLGDYLSAQQIYQVARQSKNTFALTGLCAGQSYQLCTLDDQFDSFLYDIDQDEQLLIRRQDDQFEISRVPIDYEVDEVVISGVISSSLFNAVEEIGEKPGLAITLADIYAWDIDFILDIREGDSFQAVVEKRFREGEPAGYGRILSAEFVNRGRSYQAVLFKDGSDNNPAYYDPEGKNLRTAFLKAPLSFSRISSGFTMKRFHPITKTWRAHPAIDYVAPTGTPIKTVGDGTVVRKGYTRGNGNFAEIRHINGYSTIYLHMSKFARGMGKGKRVSQGQVIGYVGSTGLATGPHLCFRMRKNGAPVNPDRIKVPSAPAVSRENMEEFLALAAPLLARLDGGEVHQAKRDEQKGEKIDS